MELTQRHLNKLKWTVRMAYASFGILAFALVVNEFRYLIGFAKGYAPHNFAFNFSFFLPAMLIAIVIGIVSIGRTIKNWTKWTGLKKKWLIIGLSFPAIGFLVFNLIKLYLINPY